jgi:uncharacterized membrane protein YqjE
MSRGLLHSAQSLLASLLALARTRMELFSTELQEELVRLFFTLIGAVAVLLLAALGAGFVGLALLIALGEEQRALAAAAIGAGFFALALAAAWSMRRLGHDKPRVFSASLAELERDREALQP